MLARQTTGGTVGQYGTRWYVVDRQNSVQGLITPQDMPNSQGEDEQHPIPTPAGSWVKVLTYGGGGVHRVWGRDFNLNDAPDRVDSIRDEFEYTGRLYDYATGLQFNRARWLNPGTGQFMGKDSLGYAAGDTNVYRYAGGDPANTTDPSGHFGLLTGALVGMAVGAAVGFGVGFAYNGPQ